jgi:UDP-glucuronate decarboxylase
MRATLNRFLQQDICEVVDALEPILDRLQGKSVLLTGAAGFLGTHLLATFAEINRRVARPVSVVALDNMISSQCLPEQMSGFPGVSFQVHDITQPIPDAVACDHILHAAGIASPVWYKLHPLATLEVSSTGTRNVLEVARRWGARVLYFSSSEIYGDPDPRHVPTSENYNGNVSCVGPRACYDEGKRVAETLCHIYHEHFGVPTVVVRPFNVFGPGMSEKDYRVLPNFGRRLKSRLPLRVYGTGAQTRTFCYVVDAIIGFMLALTRGVPGEAYNIGTPFPEISIHDLARLTCDVLGGGTGIEVVDYPDGYPSNEPTRRCPDISKAALHLGFAPRITLEEGLRRFFGWTDGVYLGADKAPGLLGVEPPVPAGLNASGQRAVGS